MPSVLLTVSIYVLMGVFLKTVQTGSKQTESKSELSYVGGYSNNHEIVILITISDCYCIRGITTFKVEILRLI